MSTVKSNKELLQETISNLSLEEKRVIFPPMVKKNFVVRASWYGRNQIIEFTNNKGEKIVYNHDVALDIMRPRLELMNAWHKYGYWSQSTNIPLSLRFKDLLTPEDKEFLNPPATNKKSTAKPKK